MRLYSLFICIILSGLSCKFKNPAEKYFYPDDPKLLVEDFVKQGRLGKMDNAIKYISSSEIVQLEQLKPVIENYSTLASKLQKEINDEITKVRYEIDELEPNSNERSEKEKILVLLNQALPYVKTYNEVLASYKEKADLKNYLKKRFPNISQADIEYGKPTVKNEKAFVPYTLYFEGKELQQPPFVLVKEKDKWRISLGYIPSPLHARAVLQSGYNKVLTQFDQARKNSKPVLPPVTKKK